MNLPHSTSLRLSRRRALTGAAWTAPAIVVASAVPSFAASPSTTLTINPGATAVTRTGGQDPTTAYFDLKFDNFVIIVPGSRSGVGANELTLTTTFTPAGNSSNRIVSLGSPAGFATTPPVPPGATSSDPVTTVVSVYGMALMPGDTVAVDGIVVGTEQPVTQQAGTYVVTVSATGYTSASRSFATPSVENGPSEARNVQRPRV